MTARVEDIERHGETNRWRDGRSERHVEAWWIEETGSMERCTEKWRV